MSKYTREKLFSVSAKQAFVEREAKLRGSERWPNMGWYSDEDFCEVYRAALALLDENAKLKSVIKDEAEPKIGELLRVYAELKEQNSRMAAMLERIHDCYTAAVAEGLYQVLNDTKDDRLKDLLNRRLLWEMEGLGTLLAEIRKENNGKS